MISKLDEILKEATDTQAVESVCCALDTLARSFVRRVGVWERALGLEGNDCRSDWDSAFARNPETVIKCAKTEMLAFDAIAWASRLSKAAHIGCD